MAERDETFLARWSRRKQAARAAEREPEPPRAAEVPTPADAHAPERRDAVERTPALPDPATFDASSDFSVFLGKHVPVETHRAALRRLWRLDPFYNRLDGLSDYCEDFTDQAKVVQRLRTAYKVGRGMLEQIGDAPAHPDETAPAQQPRDEPQRIAAGSEDRSTMPAVSFAQQSDPFAQQKGQKGSAGASARRRPRPLPKRG